MSFSLHRFLASSLIFIIFLTFYYSSNSQTDRRDKGHFIEYKNEFMDSINKEIKSFNNKKEKSKLSYKLNFSGLDLPKSKDEFIQQWHNPPLSQGNTGTCWSFSTTSFLESEIYRLNNIKVKISEMHTVYWEYVEKARRFVREFGNSPFAEGSEANGLTNIWKKYGCVPTEVYNGLKQGQPFHDHSQMFDKMNSYLKSVNETNAWNEEEVLNTIKTILNHYMGEPPTEFTYNGKKYTPLEFMRNFVKINPDDYIDIMSLMEKPYWKKVEYDVPDNWWNDSTYLNIPLDDFMTAIKDILKKGYTIAIGGDVSESGIESHSEVAMVPSFDIPSSYIDENSRQFRFSNNTTTDDHGVHIVGYKENNGSLWFLIKDSGSGSFNGNNKGYYFYHEDYIKLKMMSIMVHSSSVESLLKKFEKL